MLEVRGAEGALERRFLEAPGKMQRIPGHIQWTLTSGHGQKWLGGNCRRATGPDLAPNGRADGADGADGSRCPPGPPSFSRHPGPRVASKTGRGTQSGGCTATVERCPELWRALVGFGGLGLAWGGHPYFFIVMNQMEPRLWTRRCKPHVRSRRLLGRVLFVLLISALLLVGCKFGWSSLFLSRDGLTPWTQSPPRRLSLSDSAPPLPPRSPSLSFSLSPFPTSHSSFYTVHAFSPIHPLLQPVPAFSLHHQQLLLCRFPFPRSCIPHTVIASSASPLLSRASQAFPHPVAVQQQRLA